MIVYGESSPHRQNFAKFFTGLPPQTAQNAPDGFWTFSGRGLGQKRSEAAKGGGWGELARRVLGVKRGFGAICYFNVKAVRGALRASRGLKMAFPVNIILICCKGGVYDKYWRATGEVLRATDELSRATGELSRATDELSRATGGVGHATGEVLRATDEVLRATDEVLRAKNERLRATSGRCAASPEGWRSGSAGGRAKAEWARARREIRRASGGGGKAAGGRGG